MNKEIVNNEKYNGSRLIWTNYATWRVNLELFNLWDDDCDTDGITADECKEFAESYIEQEAEGFALSYAMLFLDEVNWQEIADSIKEKLEY